MYGPDEDDKVETVHRRTDAPGWILMMALGLLCSALTWGMAAPM